TTATIGSTRHGSLSSVDVRDISGIVSPGVPRGPASPCTAHMSLRGTRIAPCRKSLAYGDFGRSSLVTWASFVFFVVMADSAVTHGCEAGLSRPMKAVAFEGIAVGCPVVVVPKITPEVMGKPVEAS